MEKNLLKLCIDTIESKFGEDIVCIDMKSVNPFIDYFVIASVNNNKKANAIKRELFDVADKNGFSYKANYNDIDTNWLLVDLNEVVCHIFVGDEREKYNLEGLWKDLPIVKK